MMIVRHGLMLSVVALSRHQIRTGLTTTNAYTNYISFVRSSRSNRMITTRSSTTSMNSDKISSTSSICDTQPKDVESRSMLGKKGSGNLIRSAVLSDVNGQLVKLGDRMGSDTSVVIFLRHLA
mmetsp:Transcript_18851/g.21599  ORF Transcript_18851/g.21599 Transcript_18851/m.21599 type:complete len:123 (-) Transcript_18851:742-1110(-)